jgi:hypothetical protein
MFGGYGRFNMVHRQLLSAGRMVQVLIPFLDQGLVPGIAVLVLQQDDGIVFSYPALKAGSLEAHQRQQGKGGWPVADGVR